MLSVCACWGAVCVCMCLCLQTVFVYLCAFVLLSRDLSRSLCSHFVVTHVMIPVSFPLSFQMFECGTCDDSHCCSVYEHCVSCCLAPEHVGLRRLVFNNLTNTQRVGVLFWFVCAMLLLRLLLLSSHSPLTNLLLPSRPLSTSLDLSRPLSTSRPRLSLFILSPFPLISVLLH